MDTTCPSHVDELNARTEMSANPKKGWSKAKSGMKRLIHFRNKETIPEMLTLKNPYVSHHQNPVLLNFLQYFISIFLASLQNIWVSWHPFIESCSTRIQILGGGSHSVTEGPNCFHISNFKPLMETLVQIWSPSRQKTLPPPSWKSANCRKTARVWRISNLS